MSFLNGYHIWTLPISQQLLASPHHSCREKIKTINESPDVGLASCQNSRTALEWRGTKIKSLNMKREKSTKQWFPTLPPRGISKFQFSVSRDLTDIGTETLMCFICPCDRTTHHKLFTGYVTIKNRLCSHLWGTVRSLVLTEEFSFFMDENKSVFWAPKISPDLETQSVWRQPR